MDLQQKMGFTPLKTKKFGLKNFGRIFTLFRTKF